MKRDIALWAGASLFRRFTDTTKLNILSTDTSVNGTGSALKHGQLATKYRRICGYFYGVRACREASGRGDERKDHGRDAGGHLRSLGQQVLAVGR